jgi:NAD(P)-dependent dehydrogenase (short-subunit alcohol dehydrogenase family)
MRERRDGVIVNISSISAMRPSSLAGAAYSAAKAGVNALSSVVSQEEVAFLVNLSPRAHVPELVIKPTAHLWQ